MKKLIAILLSVIMIFSLAACGGGGSSDEKDKEGTVTEEQMNDNESDKKDDKEDKKDKEDKADKVDKEEVKAPSKPAQNSGSGSGKVPDKKPESKPVAQKAAGKVLAAAFRDKLAKDPSASALSIAEHVISNSVIPFSGASAEVAPGLLNGFGEAQITGFRQGAMFGPVIGTIPFIGYVFILEDGTDASAFVKTLSANANRRWNICTEAEETTIETKGNAVFFVMCNRSLDE